MERNFNNGPEGNNPSGDNNKKTALERALEKQINALGVSGSLDQTAEIALTGYIAKSEKEDILSQEAYYALDKQVKNNEKTPTIDSLKKEDSFTYIGDDAIDEHLDKELNVAEHPLETLKALEKGRVEIEKRLLRLEQAWNPETDDQALRNYKGVDYGSSGPSPKVKQRIDELSAAKDLYEEYHPVLKAKLAEWKREIGILENLTNTNQHSN